MKVLATLALLLAVAGGPRPAHASSHDPELAAPSVSCAPTRPLVHYLVATLRLPAARVTAVQHALQANRLLARTPEQVAECLAPVLSPTEYARLQALQADMASYESLRTLALR